MDDTTLGGYQQVHGRPPAFGAADGHAYSVDTFAGDAPGGDGGYGAALLFVRWGQGERPVGHLETDYLAFGPTPDAALRLVTCGGSFDDVAHHYRSNVIVFATAAPEAADRRR
jgi:hypothetical protein